MKKFLIIILGYLSISTHNLHAITKKEALEQVNGMDEKEHVERSLKTILRLLIINPEGETEAENEDDNFLPFELYLGVSFKEHDKKLSSFWGNDEKLMDREIYLNNLYKKLYTKDFFEYNYLVTHNYQRFKPIEMKCIKILGYSPHRNRCDRGIQIYKKIKTEILTLERDFAILKGVYIQDPTKWYSDLKNPDQWSGYFILKKQNGIWKLDGTQCGGREECSYHYNPTNH